MPVTPTIEVDDTLKERSSHGSFELPIETYTDNCEIFHSLYNHWHDEMELIYIESGSGLVRLNKEILRVKAGDLIIVNRGVLHGIKTDLKNILYFRSIVFDLNLLSGPAGDLCQERVISLLMDNQAEFTHIISRSDDNYGNICLLFDRIHSCHKEKKPYYFVKLKALFFSFFYEMLMEQVKEAVEAGADIIMLDNMTPEMMKEAVELIAGRAQTECSGNITKENIAKILETGVDFVSSGALTHSAPILDISMKNLHAI